jgi:hypothetical protein
LRQRPTRFTIRAGRNLPDKEFRYLRTVIVTADIHGDLGSKLRRYKYRLTSRLDLSALVTCHILYLALTAWQNAVFLLNSRLGHFTAAWRKARHPLSRSYGANLPSSLTGVHSYALVYSTHPPVSVCGTGRLACAGSFLGTNFDDADRPWPHLGIQSPGHLHSCVHPG